MSGNRYLAWVYPRGAISYGRGKSSDVSAERVHGMNMADRGFAIMGDYSFMLPNDRFDPPLYGYHRPQDALSGDLERVAVDFWNGIRAHNGQVAER